MAKIKYGTKPTTYMYNVNFHLSGLKTQNLRLEPIKMIEWAKGQHNLIQ